MTHGMALPSGPRPGADAGEPVGSVGPGESLPLVCSWFFLLGLQAHGLGLARSDNPYMAASSAHAEWQAGWGQADRDERWDRWDQESREAAYFDRL
jgi:hypothetical protein